MRQEEGQAEEMRPLTDAEIDDVAKAMLGEVLLLAHEGGTQQTILKSMDSAKAGMRRLAEVAAVKMGEILDE